VTEGPALDFPAIREVSLAGVLNSELERHLRTAVGRFIDNPHLTAQPLTRVSIFGAVPQPGFYVTPPAMLLSDALMLAGGPTAGARVDHITIERVGQRIWSGDSLRLAMVEGRTLDQLDLRDGDRIKVPQPSRGLSVVQSALSWVSMLTSIPITVFTVTRLF
jgi:protein involved in polysaccharide export with SLBB domain